MCGIAGCFGRKDEETIDKMLDALEHRGPNDRGMHTGSSFVVGHTRLSIVDVQNGHQPILDADGDRGVISNGEIYNFRKLRAKLSSDYRFQTRSDTEVILHLYQEKGPAAVKDLDGMFAFAVFDGDDYMLARDPVGIKPLYYGYKNDAFYFTSELGAMSLSGVNEVHEFPAGHYYTPAEGFVKYYEIPKIEDHLHTDVGKTSKLIRDTFIRSVKKRLLADPEVPVGAFCSGGLDSSLVAAIAARDVPNLHTFVVGMRDEETGELSDDVKAARIASKHIGSTHHEYLFTEKEYYDALPEVINKLESYDPSLVRCAIPCYFTCKAAAEHVTVVLTGEGADEIFTGYHYMKHFPADKLNLEARRCIGNLHNINLQRADRMGMLFSLELRVPFLDVEMIDLAMKIPPELKIRERNGARIEKWILRRAFEDTDYLPEEILWRYKVQYTQGAGCEDLGERLANRMCDEEYEEIRAKHPKATINSKEAAYYFKIFREYHPQDSILGSIGIWTGFDFAEEREKVRGTVDGDRKHIMDEDHEEAGRVA